MASFPPSPVQVVSWIGTTPGDPTLPHPTTNLRNLNGNSGPTTVVAMGFWGPNDGGGGVFYWDPHFASGDDGGTIIVPDQTAGQGRWVRIYSGPLNVKWFGAVGDNCTNDTTAIANAIAAAAPTSTPAVSRSVHIPAGTYLTDKITGLDDGYVLAGAGASGGGTNATILKSRTGDNVIDISGKSINHLVIRDLCIIGSGGSMWAGGSTGHGIYEHSSAPSYCQGLVIENVFIQNCTGNGILLLSAYSVKFDSVMVDNCLGNAFECGGLTTTFLNCYAMRVPTSNGSTSPAWWPCGFRVYGGVPVFIGCNGVNSGKDWGVFGSNGVGNGSTGTVGSVPVPGDQVGSGLPVTNSPCRPTFIGCNVESFTEYGLRFCELSVGEIFSTLFLPNGTNQAKAAIKFDYNDATVAIGVISATCIFEAGNGYSNAVVESYGNPGISMNAAVRQFYSDGAGASAAIPMISGAAVGSSLAIQSLAIQDPLSLTNQTTSTTSPTAGGAGALPATPQGYLTVTIDGKSQQIPYY